MRPRPWLYALFLVTLSLASAGAATPVEVITLTEAGIGPAEIIESLRVEGTVFRLTDDEVRALRDAGVDPIVLEYMQSTGEGREGSEVGAPGAATGAEYPEDGAQVHVVGKEYPEDEAVEGEPPEAPPPAPPVVLTELPDHRLEWEVKTVLLISGAAIATSGVALLTVGGADPQGLSTPRRQAPRRAAGATLAALGGCVLLSTILVELLYRPTIRVSSTARESDPPEPSLLVVPAPSPGGLGASVTGWF